MKTAAQYLDEMVADYEAATGASLDIERDGVLAPLLVAIADRLGALDEGLQAVRQQLDPSAAVGSTLDAICALVGVYREPATRSTATVTVTGVAGTAIPAGSLIEGGGADGRARWQTLADVTVGAGGTVSAEVEALELGRVEAGVGELDTIVSIVAGWSAVTNPAAASPGQTTEDDATLRARRQRSLQQGSANANALRAAVEALPDVTTAIVLENDTGAPVVVSSLTLAAHSVTVVVYPEQDTEAKALALAQVIYTHLCAGIRTEGTSAATATDINGQAKTVRWREATDDAVPVVASVTLAPGYALGQVSDAVAAAIVAVFDALTVGQVVRQLALCGAVAPIAGVEDVTITVNGSAANYNPGPLARATLDGAPTVEEAP